MYRLKQVPLLKIFVAYSTGILLASFLTNISSFGFLISLFFVSIMVLGFLVFFKKNNQNLFHFVSSATILILGLISFVSNDERSSYNHFSKYFQNSSFTKNTLKVKIKSIKKTSKGNTKIVGELHSLLASKDTVDISGQLLIYTDIKYEDSKFGIGDYLTFRSNISAIKKTQNPLTFDPRKFYHFQNIHYQAFLKSNNYSIVKNKPDINSFFRKLNLSIQKIIKQYITNPKYANIVISIMLGDKQNLDKDILHTFASTGVRHILTVSGMHVGIISIIASFIFSLLKRKNKYIHYLKLITNISFIWFYVFLTGSGAATLRAAFMITLLIIGINIRKSVNTYNLLFGSAIILLTLNPYMLFQISFILSYTAILSILIFYKPINKIIKIKKYKPLDYVWQLISLSISAQILIFPLSIFYFHSAPSLFILTAIIATPMAFTTIALGFMIVVSFFISPIITPIISYILESIVKTCMFIIKYVESISFNIGDEIYLETFDLILIYFVIALLFFSIKNRKYSYSIFASLIFILLFTDNYLIPNKNQELVIYSTKNKEIIDIYINNKCFTIQDKKLTPQTLKYTASNLRLFKNVEVVKLNNNIENKFINKKSNIIEVFDKTIVLLKDKNDLLPTNRNHIDLLVLRDSIDFNLDLLLTTYSIKNIVILKGMKYKLRKSWIVQARKAGINHWDINTKGAYISKIKSI